MTLNNSSAAFYNHVAFLLTEEMRNSYRYLREGFSGKYLDLYVIMENGVFVIIVNYVYRKKS